jgi:cyclopropane-fatty-acyl-phospholipid synthase
MIAKKKVIFFLTSLTILLIANKIMTSSPDKFITNLVEQNTDIKLHTRNKRTSKKSKNKDIIVNNKIMFEKIASNGEVGLADSYIDGDWDSDNLEQTIFVLLSKSEFFTNQIKKQSLNFIFMEIKAHIKNRIQNNSIKSSKRNISHHYDIGNDLYKKMLGKHMQYTCAYFNKPNMTLDQAQYAKMQLIAKKLDLKPNMKILDIGCGFGSMAQHLAKHYQVDVIGVTLSKEQKKYADEYFSHPRVSIELKDYRNVRGQFDRVYSVGMFEHVGRKRYKEYYDKCYDLLKQNGIMLIHTIGTNTRKSSHNSFINKYIFPEGEWSHNSFINKYIFPEGELPHIENLTHLFIDKWHLEDWQNMGLSYAKTLRAWHNNIGDWSGLENYNDRFRRMWNFYLLGCAANFQNRGICLWQIVYTKRNSNRNDDCHHIRN